MKFSLRNFTLAAALLASCATFAETVTTLWEDDFEWLAEWSAWKPVDGSKPACGDAVGTDTEDAEAKNLNTSYIGSLSDGTSVTTYQALVNKGYDFVTINASNKDARPAPQNIYLQKNYLKFGLTGYYSGIVIPVTQGADNNVFIEFDYCPQRQGSGKYDATELVVIVKNGENEMQFPVPFKQYEKNAVMEWTHEKIQLSGADINADTKIVIRNSDKQWPGSGALRFYLDNIRIYDVNPLDVITAEDFEWFGTPAANGTAINNCPDQTYDEIALNEPGKASKWSSSQYYGIWPTEEHPEYRIITAYDRMVKLGYEFEYVKAEGKKDRANIGSTVYIMENYVKFGLTGYQSNISFPAYSSVDGTAVVSFDWCPQAKGTNNAEWDDVELQVIVRNGSTVKKSFPVAKATYGAGDPLKWIHVEMPLEGVEINKGDFIEITHAASQWPDARALRWYFDNFKLMGKSKGDADPEVVAPELYLKGDFNNWTASEDSKLSSDRKFSLLDEVTYTFDVAHISGEILISTADGSVNIGKSDTDITETDKSYVLAYGDTKLPVPTLNDVHITLTYYKDTNIGPRVVITGTVPVEVTDVRKAYAYDPKASMGENGKLNVSYKSTAAAKNAALILFPEEGDAIVFELPAPVKGLNEAIVGIDDLEAGDYTWQINITSELEGEDAVIAYKSPAEWVSDASVNGGVVWIRDTTSPAFGYTVISIGKAGGFAVYNPEGELLTETPVHKGFEGLDATNGRSASRGDALGGLAVFSDWSYAASGAWVIDPLNPSAAPYNMFMAEGATRNTDNGIITYNGTQLGSGSPTVAFQGEGDDTKLFYFEESLFGNTLVRYDLGSEKYVTAAPSLIMSEYKSAMANTDIEVEALSEGFFVSQIRNDFNSNVYGLMYFNDEGEMVWNIANKGVLENTDGHSISSGIAVNADETRLALSGYNEIYVFDLSFSANGEPELTNAKIYPVPASITGTYRMQLVFDAADNLHVFSTCGQGYSVIVLPGETTASTPAPEMLTISDGAGISNIGADNDAPVEYFNLQGLRVDGNNLSNGIYIRRQGATTNKIIVK